MDHGRLPAIPLPRAQAVTPSRARAAGTPAGTKARVSTLRVGVHVGISGGYAAAVEYARRIGCTAMQIFSGNPRTYKIAPIAVDALAEFARARTAAGIDPCVIHTPYLINLASDDNKIAHGSLRLVEHDLEVAAAGGIRLVNTHLGSYGTRDRNEGFAAICKMLERALAKIAPGVELVLENSAGAGNLAGGTMEELGRFLSVLDHRQLGICLDTAHAWAAGYDIHTAQGVEAFLDTVERTIGLERVRMFHLNDTQVPLGGNRDRHWHIGEGNIGRDGFRALLAHPALREKTFILETPGDEEDDVRNLALVRELAREAGATA